MFAHKKMADILGDARRRTTRVQALIDAGATTSFTFLIDAKEKESYDRIAAILHEYCNLPQSTSVGSRTHQDSFAEFVRARQSGDICAAMSALEETLDLAPTHVEANRLLETLFCPECANRVNWRGLSGVQRKRFWSGYCPKCEMPITFFDDSSKRPGAKR